MHVLTKSTLVERDFDLLREIDAKSGAIVSMSFSGVEKKLSAIFEPGVPPPHARLATLTRAKRAGLPCGMFLLPVIPFVTDTPAHIQRSVQAGQEAGVRPTS